MNIFPTSDAYHAIVSSVFLLLSQILTFYTICGGRDVVHCLFLCNIWIESLEKSKKFCPEIIKFVQNLLKVGFLNDK